MRKYKVTISFDVENDNMPEANSSISKRCEKLLDMIKWRVPQLGFGYNHFWYLDQETIQVSVRKRWSNIF